MIRFNAADTVSMCKIGINYQYATRAVCAYAHSFRKLRGCALIGACALIRTNTVILSVKSMTIDKNFQVYIESIVCFFAHI